MIEIPVQHFETKKNGRRHVRSVISLQVETEVKNDASIHAVQKFNVRQLLKALRTARAVQKTKVSEIGDS